MRVQFHWDRVGNNDEQSSAWVRVASAWGGGELGASAVPRVGTEVIVQWLDGSPDRPIVTGTVFNELHQPPWALPSQQALTGLRSRELTPNGGSVASGRSNRLILDDANAAIQAQLKSDHAHSQLSLGHITRIEDNSGRKDGRGEGFELATEAWGALRAGKGMLLTTEARPRAVSHIKDMGETVARLSSGAALHQQMAEAAQHQEAQQAGVDQTEAEQGTGGQWLSQAGQHTMEGPKNMNAVKQAEFEKAEPKKFSQQVFVDPALWNLPSGVKALKYTFLSRTNQVLGRGTLDGKGKSTPLFTDTGEPARIEIDVNGGKWEQMIFDRHPSISVPLDAPEVVFDHYAEGAVDEASIEGPDDTLTV